MKSGHMDLLMLGIIRTCLEFHISMFPLPRDQIQDMIME